MDLIRVQFESMPALKTLESLGLVILTLATTIQIGQQAKAFIQGGTPNFVTPIVEAAFVAAIVSNISWFGTSVAELANGLSASLLSGAKTDLFEVAFEQLAKGTGSISVFDLGNIFSLRTLLGTGSLALLLAMLVAKVVILDLLWPICFGLVILLGTVALPVGLLPGMGGFNGWSKNLIEVTLWPVIFAIIAALMTSAFGGYLDAASRIDLQSLLLPDPAQTLGPSPLVDTIRFWGICLVYMASLFASPFLAMFVTRGTPIGLAAGAALGVAVRLASGFASSGVSSMVGLAGQSPSFASSGVGRLMAAASGSKTSSLDQRRNDPPAARG